MTTWLRVAIGLTLLWLIIAVVLVLQRPEETGPIAFALVWDRDGVSIDDNGQWTTTTDLGFEVTVTGGFIEVLETSAFACEHPHGVTDSIRNFFGVGHTSDEDTTATDDVPNSERMTDPAITPFGPVDGTDSSYCEAQVVYGTASGAPTVQLNLTVVDPDGASSTVSIVGGGKTTNRGPILERTDLPDPPDALRIQATRSMASLFDGIDFDGLEAEWAPQVLLNLSREAVYETSG